MKIDPVRPTAAGGAARRGGAAAEGFSIPADAVKGATGPSAIGAPGAVGAVLALQVDEGGRRQRQARRGVLSLDALDRLQAAMLGGADEASALVALRHQLAGREATGEPGLDSVLNDIDVRAAVEIAKRARTGAGRA